MAWQIDSIFHERSVYVILQIIRKKQTLNPFCYLNNIFSIRCMQPTSNPSYTSAKVSLRRCWFIRIPVTSSFCGVWIFLNEQKSDFPIDRFVLYPISFHLIASAQCEEISIRYHLKRDCLLRSQSEWLLPPAMRLLTFAQRESQLDCVKMFFRMSRIIVPAQLRDSLGMAVVFLALSADEHVKGSDKFSRYASKTH